METSSDTGNKLRALNSCESDEQSKLKIKKKIENNTWARGDVEFLLECSTRYLKSERSEKRTRCHSFMARVLCQ